MDAMNRQHRSSEKARQLLERELRDARVEIRVLEDANTNLRVELESADVLLGSAMDRLLGEDSMDA